MVIIAVAGTFELLSAVKSGTFPKPLAPSPIVVLLFVQLKEVPGTGLLNGVTGADAPLQYT
jgi:hypothetical protein